MNLFLLRHGAASHDSDNPERVLSPQGLKEVYRIGTFVATHNNIQVTIIMHSGKARARQTAEVMAEHVNPPCKVLDAKELEPNADIQPWLDRLELIEENIMLVGHLPHLERLASYLICGKQKKTLIEFKTATLVCLRKDQNKNWVLEWMVSPDTLKD